MEAHKSGTPCLFVSIPTTVLNVTRKLQFLPQMQNENFI